MNCTMMHGSTNVKRSLNYRQCNAGTILAKCPGFRNCVSFIYLDLNMTIGQHLSWTVDIQDQVSFQWALCSTAVYYTVRQMLKKAFKRPRRTSFCNHPAVESSVTNTVGFVHAKKAHGEGEAQLHSFLNFDLVGDKLSVTCPKEKKYPIHIEQELVWMLCRREISLISCQKSIHNFSVVQPITWSL